MVCAGELEGSTMACNGDSGGPLVCMRGSQPVVYGVTSWAIPGCSYSDSAPLFARVGHFRDWINEKAQEFFNRQLYPVVSQIFNHHFQIIIKFYVIFSRMKMVV